VLFVGESPPAGGAFFYAGDSQLYRSTRDAFSDSLGEGVQPFLERFVDLGCYLEDLCDEPVNRLGRERRAVHRSNEARLAGALAQLQPAVIIVLLKSIADSVDCAAYAAGLGEVERHVVTYPGRWHHHRAAFHKELTIVLSDLARRNAFS
jgi:hypothetical protein